MLNEKQKARLAELLAEEKKVGRGKLPAAEKAELVKLIKMSKGKDDDNERKPVFGNDLAWWTKQAALMDDASNLKSNWIPGMALDKAAFNFTLAGVVVFRFKQMYGCTESPLEQINLVSRDLYLKMFQKYRGITAYSASDVGIINIAGAEFIRALTKVERIYGVLNRYSRVNYNIPSVELTALGISTIVAANIRKNMSNFRYNLNQLILRAQRLCVPKDLTCIANALALLGAEYLDHDNSKGQIILFDSNNFGIFEETALKTGGSVAFVETTTASTAEEEDVLIAATADDVTFPFLERQLEALLASDSVQKIYGDYVVWFGSEQMMSFMPIPSDYVVSPVYSEAILHKMHNMEIVGYQPVSLILKSLAADDVNVLKSDAGDLTYRIYQYQDKIITKTELVSELFDPSVVTEAGNYYLHSVASAQLHDEDYYVTPSHTSLLDTYRVDVNQESIVEGSLWKVAYETFETLSDDDVLMLSFVTQTCAFEWFTEVVMYRIDPVTGRINVYYSTSRNFVTVTDAVNFAGHVALLDWAPISYEVAYDNPASANPALCIFKNVYGDLDTVIPLPLNTKAKIQNAAVLSGLTTDIQVVNSAVAK